MLNHCPNRARTAASGKAATCPLLVRGAYPSILLVKARPAVSAQFRHTLHQRIPASLLALYIALYAVRYAAWALGTEATTVVPCA